MSWQPIETAPTDTWVLVTGGKIESRSWGDGDWCLDGPLAQPAMVVARLEEDRDRWMVTLYDTACAAVWYEDPTHWQPLLELPQ